MADTVDRVKTALFGLFGPLVACLSIGLAITLSPWFSWQSNALSDLGHSVRSSVAPLFNGGLLVAGFLVIAYAILVLKSRVRITSYCVLTSALFLQLVAAFDEVYGSIHLLVSVSFFVMLSIASLAYCVEAKSTVALAAFLIGLGSWIGYFAGVYRAGIAVPEVISSLAASSWILLSSLRIYIFKEIQ